jgi:ribosomal protein S3
MAQKVNPIAVRLGLNRSSESSWFSDYYYTTLFYKDLNCKHFLSSIRQPSGKKLGVRIARCVIHHYPKRSVFHLFCLTNKGRVKAIERNIHNTNLHYSYDYRIPVVYDPKHKYTHLTLDALAEQKNSAFSVELQPKAKELSEYNSERNEFRLKKNIDISNFKLEHKQTIYLNLIKRICNHSKKNTGYFYSSSHLNSSKSCLKQILLLKRLEEHFKEMSFSFFHTNTTAELLPVTLDKQPLFFFIPNLALSKVNLNTQLPFFFCKQKDNDNIIKKLINDTKKRHCVDRFSVEENKETMFSSSCVKKHSLHEALKKTAVSTLNSSKTSKKQNLFCLDWISMNQLYCASGWTHIMETKIREWITYNKTTETSTFKKNTLTSTAVSPKQKKETTSLPTQVPFVFLEKTNPACLLKPQLTRKATQMRKDLSSNLNSLDEQISTASSFSFLFRASVLPVSVLSYELKANMNYLAMWYWKQQKLRTNAKFNCNYNVITQQLRAVRLTLNEPSLTKSSHYHFTNIQSFLTSQTNTLTLIVPVKVSSIYQSASLVAQEICCKLEQKRAFRQICKSVFRQIDLCKYIKGIRISCSGRLNGAEIAKSECKKFGETSLHVFSDQIDYAYAKASTASGILGVKVWISYNCS